MSGSEVSNRVRAKGGKVGSDQKGPGGNQGTSAGQNFPGRQGTRGADASQVVRLMCTVGGSPASVAAGRHRRWLSVGQGNATKNQKEAVSGDPDLC